MKRFYILSVLSLIAIIATGVSGYGPGIPVSMLIGVFTLVFWFFIGGINIVNQWARRPVLRLGKYRGEVGPGLVFLNPAIEWPLDDIFVRDNVVEIELKGVQTKDNVPLSFKLVLTTRVNDVRKAVLEVADFERAIEQRAMAAANGTIRAHDLSEILGTGLSFPEQILKSLVEKISLWGIEAKAVEVKDFRILDVDIEKAISMKARAQKEAEAELTRAVMQKEIALKLNEAADALDDEGWRYKALETLLELTRSAANNTILIPTELSSLARALSLSK